MKLEDFMDEFDVTLCKDNYGQHMVESSLADWLELAALRGVKSPWSDVADRWGDAGVGESGKSGVIAAGEVEPDVLNYFELVHDEISIRSDYLGYKYPFEFDQFDSLVVKPDFHICQSFYVDLLCISLIKGFRDTKNNGLLRLMTQYFELLVNASIEARIKSSGGWIRLRTAVIGTASNGHTFDTRLQSAAHNLGLTFDPTVAPRSSMAKDDGVDVVSGIVWGDDNGLDDLFLIQAACGKSSEWRGKLDRVHRPKWAGYFLERAEPRSVIAIPYHATRRAINIAIDCFGNHSYLDRLRLVDLAGKSIPTGDELFTDIRTTVTKAIREELGITAFFV